MRITRMSAGHYLSMENLEISLEDRTILVGMNNAGKSNILSIPRFFQEAFLEGSYSAPMKRLGGFRAISRGEDDRQSISLALEIQDDNQETRFVWTIGLNLLRRNPPADSGITARERIYEITRGEPPRVILENTGVQSWHEAGAEPGRRGSSPGDPGENLTDACTVPRACQEAQFPAREISEYIRAWRCIRPPRCREDKLRTMGRIRASPEKTQSRIMNITRDVTGWPNGDRPGTIAPSCNTVSVMEIAEALWANRDPRLIVLDTPEQGLHPDAVERLGEHLRQAPPEAQLLISTQSPQLAYQTAARAESIMLIRDSQVDTTV